MSVPSWSTVVEALDSALADEPGRPLVTFYDGSTGERVELSVTTFANWVTKIANLYGDELMVEPGETVHVALPTHWQSTVAIVGAWTCGLAVSLGADVPGDASVCVVGPGALQTPDVFPGTVLACSLRPLGGPFTEPLPGGWADFAVEVPAQPDQLLTPAVASPEAVALRAPSGPHTHADLVRRASTAAEAVGLGPGGRLLTDLNPASPDGVATALAAPLLVAASVVLVTGMDERELDAVARQEQVTGRATSSR